MAVILTRGLGKHYGARPALDHLDLEVHEGEVFGFLGNNGAGKTTTIRLLLGLMRPTRGAAWILGHDCWRDAPRIKADVGYVPGDLRLYPWMNVRGALASVGRIRGRHLMRPGLELAERFGLDPSVRANAMSRGMRQQLGLILALVHEPRLLILDEPTSGLDPRMRDRLVDCLRERSRAGATVFVSSHELSEVERLCDRVAMVREGRSVMVGELDVLRTQASRSVTLRFAAERPSASDLPSDLVVRHRAGRVWSGSWSGSSDALAMWAKANGVVDFSIEAPDLESLFREYYLEREKTP
ncbi:MAG: ABC transporter ATP-binding protein [Planctomycetes bacterium]|nr:ABC transporter ATP-binding protein [Planctomycetota bacterium]